MILLIDNYDSFTYNLTDYFKQLGEEITVVKNDAVDAETINQYEFNRLVLSPGPNRPEEAGYLMQIINACVVKTPILGICLGHQALGEYFGAKLTHAPLPVHGKVSEIKHMADGVYKGLPERFNVCRYHSLVLEDLSHTPLLPTSETEDGITMSFKHKSLPITGIQYHPEAILTENGLKILENWLRLTDSNAV